MSRKWIAPLVALLMAVAVVVAWGSLPELVPTHWGPSGEADGWGSRSSLFILPAVALGLWALFWLLLRLGPRHENLERSRETWWLVANCSVLMLAVVHFAQLAAGLGWRVDVARLVMVASCFLIIAIGNYLPRLKPNWWMGIRTPWTLESDEVWRETHRTGGRWMVIGGILAVPAVFLPAPTNLHVFMAILVGVSLAAVIYSYVLWRRLRGDDRSHAQSS